MVQNVKMLPMQQNLSYAKNQDRESWCNNWHQSPELEYMRFWPKILSRNGSQVKNLTGHHSEALVSTSWYQYGKQENLDCRYFWQAGDMLEVEIVYNQLGWATINDELVFIMLKRSQIEDIFVRKNLR